MSAEELSALLILFRCLIHLQLSYFAYFLEREFIQNSVRQFFVDQFDTKNYLQLSSQFRSANLSWYVCVASQVVRSFASCRSNF